MSREMDLLFQASRTSPMLHEAAVSVEWELQEALRRAERAELTVSTVAKMATRGVGPDTTPEQVLETIANYISIRTEKSE